MPLPLDAGGGCWLWPLAEFLRSEVFLSPLDQPQGDPAASPLLSVVVPVYNEAEIVVSWYGRLTAVLQSHRIDHEVVIVDDGSEDGTLGVLRDLANADPRIRYVSLSRNFGHQVALKAGLDRARGHVVVTLDGDGQHPPELIPRLLELWGEGHDIVNTRRRSNAGEGLLKRALSRSVYPALRRFSGLALEPGLADFRLLDRRVVDVLSRLREHHVFFRGLVPWLGFSAAIVDYDADPRLGGQSKYTLRKQWELAVNGLFSFSAFPLRAMNFVGMLSALLAFVYSVYVVYTYASGGTVPGWASLAIGLMFVLAYLSFCFGALGEYIGRMYIETLGRPLYVVKEASGSRGAEPSVKQERRALLGRGKL